MPRPANSRPVASRDRLRAYQDRGSDASASRGIRGSWSVEHDVMVLDAVDDPPRVAESGRRVERCGQRGHIDERTTAARGLRDRGADTVAQPIAPGRIEAEPRWRRPHRRRTIVRPVFRDLDRLRPDEPRRAGHVLAEPTAAVSVDHRDLVVADAVDVEFLQALLDVVDQELADILVPVGEYVAADPALVGEIQTAVVVAVRLAVEELDRLVVEAGARMVEHQVEQHGDAVQMQDVDHAAELIGRGAQLIERQRRLVRAGEERVRLPQIAAQFAIVRDMVVHLGRIQIEAVVAAAGLAGEFLDRQELHAVDAEIAQIIDAIEQVEELADAAPLVVALRIDGVIRADMELIQDEVAKLRRDGSRRRARDSLPGRAPDNRSSDRPG